MQSLTAFNLRLWRSHLLDLLCRGGGCCCFQTKQSHAVSPWDRGSSGQAFHFPMHLNSPYPTQTVCWNLPSGRLNFCEFSLSDQYYPEFFFFPLPKQVEVGLICQHPWIHVLHQDVICLFSSELMGKSPPRSEWERPLAGCHGIKNWDSLVAKQLNLEWGRIVACCYGT